MDQVFDLFSIQFTLILLQTETIRWRVKLCISYGINGKISLGFSHEISADITNILDHKESKAFVFVVCDYGNCHAVFVSEWELLKIEIRNFPAVKESILDELRK